MDCAFEGRSPEPPNIDFRKMVEEYSFYGQVGSIFMVDALSSSFKVLTLATQGIPIEPAMSHKINNQRPIDEHHREIVSDHDAANF